MGFLICSPSKCINYGRQISNSSNSDIYQSSDSKNVLENEGIETYIHNVNQIQPVVSSGVRLRIKESDLPHALKITESSAWLSESIVGEKETKGEKSNKILIPVDFSSYSMKACEFAFNLAKTENAEIILLHVYFTPIYASSLPYGDVFNYQIGDEESVKTIIHKVHSDLKALSDKIKDKVESGNFQMSNIAVFYVKAFQKKKY